MCLWKYERAPLSWPDCSVVQLPAPLGGLVDSDSPTERDPQRQRTVRPMGFADHHSAAARRCLERPAALQDVVRLSFLSCPHQHPSVQNARQFSPTRRPSSLGSPLQRPNRRPVLQNLLRPQPLEALGSFPRQRLESAVCRRRHHELVQVLLPRVGPADSRPRSGRRSDPQSVG